MMDAQEAITAEGFAALQEERLKRKIDVFPMRSWWPSAIGHPCDRYLVWRWTMWEAQRTHDTTLQSIFDEGHLHQPDVYVKLEAMGFKIVRESDRPRKWRAGAAEISGRVDGRIVAFRDTKYEPSLLLEIKSCAAHAWDSVDRIEDLAKHRDHYMRAYYTQFMVSAALEDCERGLGVLKNKATGLLKAIPFTVDLAHTEETLQRIERLQGVVQRLEDPPPIPYEPRICDRCGFNYLCWPPRVEGDGVAVLDDSGLTEELEAYERLKPLSKEYEDLDKALKAKLRKLVQGQVLCGGFLIEVKEKVVAAEKAPRPARTDYVVSIKRL